MRVKVKNKAQLVIFVIAGVVSSIVIPFIVLKWSVVGACIMCILGTLEKE